MSNGSGERYVKMTGTGKKIELDQCKKGYLYRTMSTWIGHGVYDGDSGFIGIREKFDREFLMTDYHVDAEGSAIPLEEICAVPDGIEIIENKKGTWDSFSGREMLFDKPKSEGGRGHYFKDTGEAPIEGEMYCPCIVSNEKLFDWLMEKDKEY